ncbi:MAG: DinB family protein [Reichenbachiella sp.]
MKTIKTTLTAVALFIITLSCQSAEVNDAKKVSTFAQETARIWKDQKEFALALIEQMPEEKMEYSPMDSIRTFSQLFKHISNTQLILETIFSQVELSTKFPEFGKAEAVALNKSELKTLVSTSYDVCIASFENMSDKELDTRYNFTFFPTGPFTKSYREVITAMSAHIIHHRAQATIYLRMNSIKPAQYQHYW